MHVLEIVAVILGTLAVIGVVAFLVFRAEVRKEERAHARSLHDTAYGKGVPFTRPAGDAAGRTSGRGRFDMDGGAGGGD